MNYLALDTSTRRASVALATADGAVRVAAPDPAERHGRALIPALGSLLREAGLTVADLDLLAVGLGPGSYTGLRIGVTAAKTLAYAARKPLVGFDSLEAIARNAPAEFALVTVVADAQRGDLYVADFGRPNPTGPLVRTAPTRVEPQSLWADRLVAGTLVLGPALERPSMVLPETVLMAPPELSRPEGRQLVALARDLWDAGRRDDPWLLEPLYLRRSAAEDQWEALGKSAANR